MSNDTPDVLANEDLSDEATVEAADTVARSVNGAPQANDDGPATVAAVGVVAAGALVFEAALLPGLILGVAAALTPRYLPQIGSALYPVYRSTVRGAYKLSQRSREAFAEAQEVFHDIAAEVDAEDRAQAGAKGTKNTASASRAPAPN